MRRTGVAATADPAAGILAAGTPVTARIEIPATVRTGILVPAPVETSAVPIAMRIGGVADNAALQFILNSTETQEFQ